MTHCKTALSLFLAMTLVVAASAAEATKQAPTGQRDPATAANVAARPISTGVSSAASPKVAAKPTGPALFPIEAQVLAQTNFQRARYGLPPLVVDARLTQSARSHAAWMTSRRTLRHTSSAVAENIAMGQRSAPEVLNSWMSSSGHRANILNRNHRRIGVSAYSAADGTVYWCQQFMN